MFPINLFAINKVQESENLGVFNIGPLPKGYGSTMATVFRRILMSSIPGSAITSVKVKGIEHEYSTLSGLQDDVLTMLLKVKLIEVVSHSDEPVKLQLHAKGKKDGVLEVKAGDIEPNAQVEIMNPDHVIALLTDANATLDIEFTVEKGIGYALPSDSVRQELGAIPLDAVFSPVKNVAYTISHARVGQQTDLDQLELKVVTDGTILPSAAMYEATQILLKVSEHLESSAKDLLNSVGENQVLEANLPVANDSVAHSASIGTPLIVSELGLSTRLVNALHNSGYEDLRMLDGLTEEEVRNIKGMGDKSFVELLQAVKDNGLKLI